MTRRRCSNLLTWLNLADIAEAALAIVVAVEKASRFGVSDAAVPSSRWCWRLGGRRRLQLGWLPWALEKSAPCLASPKSTQILAVVPFGYPVEPGGQGKKKRKPLDEASSDGRYGGSRG